MPLSRFWIYFAIMVGSTYLIRAIPFAAVRGKIRNTFLRSFLYYIPYAVLTAMTVPSALYATGSMISAAVGLCVAVLLAMRGLSLTPVAAISCLSVLAVDLLLPYIM